MLNLLIMLCSDHSEHQILLIVLFEVIIEYSIFSPMWQYVSRQQSFCDTNLRNVSVVYVHFDKFSWVASEFRNVLKRTAECYYKLLQFGLFCIRI